MEASACAEFVADRPENMVLNTPRAVAATGRDLFWRELVAGLTFLWSRCTRVTVLASLHGGVVVCQVAWGGEAWAGGFKYDTLFRA